MTEPEQPIVLPDDPHDLHFAIVQAQQRAARFLLIQGRALRKMKDGAYTDSLGYGGTAWSAFTDTWESYLAQPELALSRSEARLLMAASEAVGMAGLNDTEAVAIPLSKLARIAGVVRRFFKRGGHNDEFEAILSDARELSRSDLKTKYGAKRREKPEKPDAMGRTVIAALGLSAYKRVDAKTIRLVGPKGAVLTAYVREDTTLGVSVE